MLRMVDSFIHWWECFRRVHNALVLYQKLCITMFFSKGAQFHVKAVRLKHVHGPREELDDHHPMIIGINHWSKVIRHNSKMTWTWQTINLNLQILGRTRQTRFWYGEDTKPFKYMGSCREKIPITKWNFFGLLSSFMRNR